MRFGRTKNQRWQRRFAWVPVYAEEGGGYCWAWLETVGCRWLPNGLDWTPQYRCLEAA